MVGILCNINHFLFINSIRNEIHFYTILKLINIMKNIKTINNETVQTTLKINKDITLDLSINFRYSTFSVSLNEQVKYLPKGSSIASGFYTHDNKNVIFDDIMKELMFFDEILQKLVTKEYKKLIK